MKHSSIEILNNRKYIAENPFFKLLEVYLRKCCTFKFCKFMGEIDSITPIKKVTVKAE